VAYAGAFAGACFPHAEKMAATVLSLPMGPHLSDSNISHTIKAFR